MKLHMTWITLFPLDWSLVPKISKRHFLKGILNSYHEVTVTGLEPPKEKFGEKISTTLVASPPQTFDIRGGGADVQVVLWPNFFCHFIKDLSQKPGENFKKKC